MNNPQLVWNAGGWFGSQLGASLWLLVAALLAAIQAPEVGLKLLLVFLFANTVGYLLWHKRWFSCYASIQALIGLLGLCSLYAIYLLDHAQLWRAIQKGGSISAQSGYYLVAAVTLILMLMFYIRFGGSRNQ